MNRLCFAAVIISILCLIGCKNSHTKNSVALEAVLQTSLPPDATHAVNIALESFMPKTPYSALVQNTAIERLDTLGRYPSDSHDYVTYLFTVKVLETYRGPVISSLEYRLNSEIGPTPILDKVPYIVTLCNDEDGYLWPDIGASLPATIETVRKARQLAKSLDSKQLSFSDCE